MKHIYLSLFLALGLSFGFSAATAQDDIWEHTTSKSTIFRSGGSILVPKDQMSHGRLGRDCGQYVVPHDAMDETLDLTRGINQDGTVCYDIEKIEREMGVTDGAWDHKTLIRVNLRLEALKELNLRWPKENDCVPYDNWRDGITRCCGLPVGYIDPAPADYYMVIEKEVKPCKHTAPAIPVPSWFPLPCCIPHCCGCIPITFPKDVH